jgi:hypothetical protein
MSKPIPPCRFCGADLRRAKSRIIVDEGRQRPAGTPSRWGCCNKPECIERFRKDNPFAR